MKKLIALTALVLSLALPSVAAAECFVGYKAKQDNPLRLHYGVLSLQASTCPGTAQAAKIAAGRLAAGGWTLLNVISLSTDNPTPDMEANAGEFYLRF
ncbi:hypothetical protein [Tropicibacter alexandrii]|jgi:hypothetical protein|uniref:hypothetical protein n=1 Tax=Tropicibacter alexandrii TaxID=2267683 RepID=UPI000EF49230|nr:hypothetical protein [Tropicibacter alexandrii]